MLWRWPHARKLMVEAQALVAAVPPFQDESGAQTCERSALCHAQVFAIGAATVMAQRPSLDADSLRGSGIINLSRVSKFMDSPSGSRTSNGAHLGAVPAQRNTPADDGSSPAASAHLGRIEVAAEHAAVAAAAAAAAVAEAAESHAARETSPSSDSQLDARQVAAVMEPPEWFIRCSCICWRMWHGADFHAAGGCMHEHCQSMRSRAPWAYSSPSYNSGTMGQPDVLLVRQGPDEGAPARVGPAAVQL